MKCIFSIFLLAVSLMVNGQFSNKTKKIIGTWEYRSGNGFENWVLEGQRIKGSAYRVDKLGETTKVEDLVIRKMNNHLVYTIYSKEVIGDTTIQNAHNFVGTKNKMKFANVESNLPEMITYSFGFLNRNKMKIKIQYGFKDKPVRLILYRIKE